MLVIIFSLNKFVCSDNLLKDAKLHNEDFNMQSLQDSECRDDGETLDKHDSAELSGNMILAHKLPTSLFLFNFTLIPVS